MKDKKSFPYEFLIIFIFIIGIVIFFIKGVPPYKNKKVEPAVKQVSQTDVKPRIYLSDKTKVTIYVPNDKFDGYVTKETEYSGKGTDIQKQIINDVLFDKIKNSSKSKIPDNAKVIDLKVWDETLSVNFSKEMLNAKVDDPNAEKYIIGSVVNSLLTSSKSFTDVQFLIDGQKTSKLFGHYNTKEPLTHIQ